MHVLEQRLADLLGDAAVQLAERGRLVDDPPEVVDTGEALDPHLAGVGVDLDLHGVGAVREGGVQPLEVELGDAAGAQLAVALLRRSEEHTSELQSLMRISYAVFCLNKKKNVNSPEPRKS